MGTKYKGFHILLKSLEIPVIISKGTMPKKKENYTMAKPTVADLSKQMESMAKMLADLKAQNESLAKELEVERAKPKTLPAVEIKGQVKDGFLLLKMPVADYFSETIENKKTGDSVTVEYLFKSGYKAADIQGLDGHKIKISVYKSPKK